MRILLHSRFYPNIGGIETVANVLAHEWHRAGASVTVVSDIHGTREQSREFPFPVHYRPNALQWLRLMHWSDVFVHMNISLKALWPWLIVRRPFVAVHQGCYFVSRRKNRNWKEKLKLVCARRAEANIAASKYIAVETGLNCDIVPNSYDCSLFHFANSAVRKRDLVFVGRLVSDKGCEVLIQALRQLAGRNLYPKVTIIGDGPERSALEQLAMSLDLRDRITFIGSRSQEDVADVLRQHNILIVPSLWEEPFGIVALEGAACGCVVLGSDGGGLPEAIGPCGLTFRRGDVSDLVCRLAFLLQCREEWSRYRAAARAHLELHQPTTVAKLYLDICERVLHKYRHRTRHHRQSH